MKWLVLAMWLLQTAVTVSISPDSGSAGTSFDVAGSGFTPGERVKITWDGSALGGTVGVGDDGTFAYHGAVPVDAQPGTHVLDARVRGGVVRQVEFTVTVPQTTTSAASTTMASGGTTVSSLSNVGTTTATPATTVASPSTVDGSVSEATTPPSEAFESAHASTAPDDGTATTRSKREPDGEPLGMLTLGIWIAVVAAGIGLVAWRRPSPEGPSGPKDLEHEASSPTLAEPMVVSDSNDEWTRVPLALRPEGRVDGVVGTSGGWIAFGSTGEIGDVAVWRSADGVEWESVVVLQPGRIRVCLPWGEGVFLLGSVQTPHGPTPGHWFSEDLESWTHTRDHDRSRTAVAYEGAALAGGAVVAHGRGPAGPGTWATLDGESWDDTMLRADVDVIAATPGGLVAIGRGVEDRRPVVARSVDGFEWVDAATDPFVFDGASVTSIVPFEGGLVAGGHDLAQDGAAVWVSDDGSRWLRVPFPAPPASSIFRVDVVDGRLLAIGTDKGRSRRGEVVVWESTDAVSWQMVDTARLFARSTVAAVAVSDDRALAVGHITRGGLIDGADTVPVTWIRRPAVASAVFEVASRD